MLCSPPPGLFAGEGETRNNVEVAVGVVGVPETMAVGVRPTGRIGISAM